MIINYHTRQSYRIHPWRLTFNIIMEVWKIIFLSKWVICRFHVNLPGCIYYYSFDIEALGFLVKTTPQPPDNNNVFPTSFQPLFPTSGNSQHRDLPPGLCGVDQSSDLGLLQNLGSQEFWVDLGSNKNTRGWYTPRKFKISTWKFTIPKP